MKSKQKLIVGVDEAGRGAWAGPLIAAAVALDLEIPELKDSKTITSKARESLYKTILSSAQVGIGQVSCRNIDNRGLSWAQTHAMTRAVEDLDADSDEIIVDGKIDYLGLSNSRAMIKADSKVEAVMAASIVAKVYRDALMAGMEDGFPGYGFKRHKGYGTKAHAEALELLGVCRQHRRSYKPVAAFL